MPYWVVCATSVRRAMSRKPKYIFIVITTRTIKNDAEKKTIQAESNYPMLTKQNTKKTFKRTNFFFYIQEQKAHKYYE